MKISFDSTIGSALKTSQTRTALAASITVGVIGLDLLFAGKDWTSLRLYRVFAAVSGFGLYLVLTRGDLRSLGLRLCTNQSWLYWGKVTFVLGAIVAAIVVAATAVAIACGVDLSKYRLFQRPSDIWPWLWHACVLAPLLEETLYRLVLCVPAVVIIKPAGAVFLSGAVFASLHFVYGNPGPDNFVAGFVLAWAYLKSGTFLVPLGLHALGNLCVGLIHLAECCW